MRDRSIKIGVDARMLFSSGIGRFLRGILSELDLQNVATTFFCKESDEAFLTHLFPKARIVYDRSDIYSIAEQFSPRAKASNIDILWCPHYNIPVLTRAKLFVTVHDVIHLAMPEFFGGWKHKVYARSMFRTVCIKAEKIHCVSTFTAQELQQHLDVSEKKLTIIPNGIDPQWFEPVNSQPIEMVNPFILFVGNMKPHKNLARLIKAFEQIADKVEHDLVVIGQLGGFRVGDDPGAYIPNQLKSRIQVLGTVSDEQLKSYYRQCSLFVFPSLYEGFGLPPLEAMASGAPVLCSNAASLPEACGSAVTYFDPLSVSDIAAKILFMLTRSSQDLGRVAVEGKSHAQSFSWKLAAEKIHTELLAMGG